MASVADGRLARAIALLEAQLAAGPQPARAMRDAAESAGVNQHILAQAKNRVGVHSARIAGRWEWSIWRKRP